MGITIMGKPEIERRQIFVIQGMHCGACVRRVSAALQRVEGIEIESVSVGLAVVLTSGNSSTQNALAEIQRIGFQATLQS